MNARAEIHWSGSQQDRLALAGPHDWSHLKGIEGLWPELERLYGASVALEAPHGRHPETFRFDELRQAIDGAAAAFVDLGVRPGDVVALFAENSPRWLVADQGLMRLGAADAVRGSTAPAEELRYILEDSGAVGAVLESNALLPHLALEAEVLQRLRFVVLLEGDAPPVPLPVPCLTWSDLKARAAGLTPPPWPSGGPERLATLLYTSGTTGLPKGVPLTHANLLHQLRTLGVAVSPRPGDQVLSVLPIWHAYERTAEYFLLSCGCHQTYTTLKHLRSDLQNVQPQYLISVPRLWEALLSGFEDALAAMPASRQRLLRRAIALSRGFHLNRRVALDLTLRPETPLNRLGGAAGALLRWPLHALANAVLWPKVRGQLVGGRLRTAISGGSALGIHVDGFFEAVGIELLVGYGLSETSPVLSCRRAWRNRRGSSGQPLPETSLKVVDPSSGATLAIGERGLVLAKGPQVMGGYHRKPEATARVLDADGWFNTGDLGLLMADGSLVLTGRAKDTIVLSSGENIEPGPLEEALVALPLVEQVMLVGHDRKQLGALVVPRAEALQEFAAGVGLSPPPEAAPLAADPALLRAISRECNRLLAARPGSRQDERLGGVALVEPFTIDNGLLTQTLKLRRDRITERHAAAIAAIYGEA